MTKMDLVKDLAKTAEITQDDAKEIIDSFLKSITNGLKKDNVVQITGFGTFKLKHVEAHEGHNPKDVSEKIMIPARNQVSFTSGAQLKADVNAPVKKAAPAKKVAKKKKK